MTSYKKVSSFLSREIDAAARRVFKFVPLGAVKKEINSRYRAKTKNKIKKGRYDDIVLPLPTQ